MSKVVQAVIGVAEVVVGAVLDAYGYVVAGQGLIASGLSQLLNVAAQLLNSPHRPPVSPIDINYAGTLEPRRIIYGTLKVGGMHAIPPLTSGSNNDMLHMVLVVSGHGPEALEEAYLPGAR